MRVRVVRGELERPSWVERLMTREQTFISQGGEYEVHAIVSFEGRLHLQVIDDVQMPGWYPSWYFDVIDPSIPGDWICTIGNTQAQLLIGPEFVARSEEEYSRMVELDADLVERFWRRVGQTSSD